VTEETKDPTNEQAIGDDIEEFLAGVGQDATKVTVYRDDGAGSPIYVLTLPWAGFSVEQLAERLGGGTYSLRVYGPPSKKYKGGYRGTKEVRIYGPPKDLTKVLQEETDAERERRRADEAERRVHELEKQNADDRVVSALRELQTAIIDIRKPAPAEAESSGNVLKMFLELQAEMFARFMPHVNTPAADTGAGLFDSFFKGLELGRDMGGNGDEGYLGVVKSLGVPLVQYLQNRGVDPRVLAGHLPAPTPGQLPPPSPPPMTNTEPGQTPRLEDALRPFVPTLVSWASSGRNAEVMADYIVQVLDEPWTSGLAEFLATEQAGAITKFLAWFPECTPHREWFGRLLHGLSEDLLEDLPADEIPPKG